MTNYAIATADGASDAVRVGASSNETTVTVTASTWGGSTSVGLEFSCQGTRWSPISNDSGVIAITANGSHTVRGRGFVRMNVTSYSGSADLYLDSV